MMDDIPAHSDECPKERFIEYGEVKETVQPLLIFWERYGIYLNEDGLEHLAFAFKLEMEDIMELVVEVDDGDDETRYKLWDYNCPLCEQFLGEQEEVYAILFHSELGSYRLVCGDCRKKMEVVQKL